MGSKPPIKRVPREKVAILHVCEQRDAISQLIKTTDKLSVIITGNGNPKEGYVYKVIEQGNDIKAINEKLTVINAIIKELHEKSIGKNEVEKTDAEKRVERRMEWQKWLQTGMFIVAAIGLIVTAYFGWKNNKGQAKLETRVDNLGVPINTRNGQIINMPPDIEIKFWPKDFVIDSSNVEDAINKLK